MGGGKCADILLNELQRVQDSKGYIVEEDIVRIAEIKEDVEFVLTIRELAKLIKRYSIDFVH